jgi:hypothetical protein
MARRSILTVVVVLAAVCFSKPMSTAGPMLNSDWVFVDSMRIDGTETKTTKAFGIDKGAQLSLLIEARDDSSSGFADDSASVQVKLYQVWPVSVGSREYFVRLNSKAHPDSTYPGADWILFDSLDILDMDTASYYHRDVTIDSTGNRGKVRVWGDSLVTADSVGVVGAVEYIDFAPDFSPALMLQLTGNLRNAKRGVGSMWIVRVTQLGGTPVKNK